MAEDTGFTLLPGRVPLLVSMPHAGTDLPPDISGRLADPLRALDDTDWHLAEVYDFAQSLGASTLCAHWSRVAVDLNRPPDDTPMYPGSNNTGLCPVKSFAGTMLYRQGAAPTSAEIAARRERYWRPYHEALEGELARLAQAHGRAVLFDAHSIRSVLPWLFEGKLPDLNLGTAAGTSCDPGLRERLARSLGSQSRYTVAVDGRFRGGYITRHYGQPARGWHAVQLEMCWSCYMDEDPPGPVDPRRMLHLRPVLEDLLATAIEWAAGLGA